ncbi:methyltransferase [Candidatus Micrarchaeota archaeon]|nr:methyltransferase [Candidatus Micrarchaeota archaeon]
MISSSFEFKGLNFDVFRQVYPPQEDSFMLAEFSPLLKGNILEIGCGCGIQSVLNAVSNPENTVLGADINPLAVKNSVHNASKNKIKNAEFINSDLFSNVPSRLFDGIIFNPPYLPTSESEVLSDYENYAYDGGADGRETVDSFLKQFGNFLKPNGSVLFVQSSLNSPEKTFDYLNDRNFKVKILAEKPFFFEKIQIMLICTASALQ